MGCSAPEYLRTRGEDEFRRAELEALRRAVDSDGVVATGGGVVTTPAARELLGREFTVWLDCEDAVILGRLSEGDRPLLGADPATSLARLRRGRSGFYREVSRARVDANGLLDVVIERVLQVLQA